MLWKLSMSQYRFSFVLQPYLKYTLFPARQQKDTEVRKSHLDGNLLCVWSPHQANTNRLEKVHCWELIWNRSQKGIFNIWSWTDVLWCMMKVGQLERILCFTKNSVAQENNRLSKCLCGFKPCFYWIVSRNKKVSKQKSHFS